MFFFFGAIAQIEIQVCAQQVSVKHFLFLILFIVCSMYCSRMCALKKGMIWLEIKFKSTMMIMVYCNLQCWIAFILKLNTKIQVMRNPWFLCNYVNKSQSFETKFGALSLQFFLSNHYRWLCPAASNFRSLLGKGRGSKLKLDTELCKAIHSISPTDLQLKFPSCIFIIK